MIRKVEPRKDSRGSITDDSKKPLDRKLEETFLIRWSHLSSEEEEKKKKERKKGGGEEK